MKIALVLQLLFLVSFRMSAGDLRGQVICGDETADGISVSLNGGIYFTLCRADGYFEFRDLPEGLYLLSISGVGFESYHDSIRVKSPLTRLASIRLKQTGMALKEIVVTGALRETERSESPVPIEIYRASFLRKNPGSCLFDMASMINGLRPQITCNVCQAGDIRINGMDGPYSLVLIDGMPIVSGLSSVYGLSGIPAGLIDRLEVVKGPASTLYGSDAMAGIINVITAKPGNTIHAGLDHYTTSWQEHQSDLWVQAPIYKHHAVAGGISHYLYDQKKDKNHDGFMDLALQKRLSVFNSWRFRVKEGKYLQLAGRYFRENRAGGEMSWTPKFIGSDSIYGESIRTERWEMFASQQLPVKENLEWQFSWNRHRQRSMYGITPYDALQTVIFGQIFWHKGLGERHSILGGTGVRYLHYEDDTPATTGEGYHRIGQRVIPGIFIQDEWRLLQDVTLLAGYRADVDPVHGLVHSPRLSCRWNAGGGHEIRTGTGSGYRVVNLFTEDHAALSGSREVEILENLKPERSRSVYAEHRIERKSVNYGFILSTQLFYTYFSNRIVGDFDSDPDKILYRNLKGYAYTAGGSWNMSLNIKERWNASAGITYNEVMLVSELSNRAQVKQQQVYAPRWSGVWEAGYRICEELRLDLTANWNGSMRLPVQVNDYRPEYSPPVHLINIKMSYRLNEHIEFWAGVKNILNTRGRDPLMRAFDPFDKLAADVASNPEGYTFDTAYHYAPMQGIRFYGGISLKR